MEIKRYDHDITDLNVYKHPGEAVRYGRKSDGGYVYINTGDTHDILLSGGIANDVSFEHDFISNGHVDLALLCDGEYYKNTNNADRYAFSNQIKNNPQFLHPGFKFINKNIGAHVTDNTINLHDIITSYNNIMVKMDIEGGEYDWINSLQSHHLSRISQICIEIHEPQISAERWSIFKKLNTHHMLVHVHANNWLGVNSYAMIQDKYVPRVIECTYINKNLIQSPILNNIPFPTHIEYSNFAHKQELVLNYPPFCHS
jgi:hypothetical protein